MRLLLENDELLIEIRNEDERLLDAYVFWSLISKSGMSRKQMFVAEIAVESYCEEGCSLDDDADFGFQIGSKTKAFLDAARSLVDAWDEHDRKKFGHINHAD